MKLRDLLPRGFFLKHMSATSQPLRILHPTSAARLLDVEVKIEHRESHGKSEFMKWPGMHRNVHVWWELENGKAVAWNQGSKEWSFPVITLNRKARAKLHIWDSRGDYLELDTHLYVCAASLQKAINLIKRTGYRDLTRWELDHHFNKDCSGLVMEGIARKPGVWLVRKEGRKPQRLI